VHSAGCYSERETYSEHFVTEESIAILSMLRSPVFTDFPSLRVMISHGGGSVPYQIGRWQAEVLHPALGGGPHAERFETALRRFWFDSVLHYPPSLELLLRTVGTDRVLFGTEKPGSGSAPNPDTGRDFDDLRPVIEGARHLRGVRRPGQARPFRRRRRTQVTRGAAPRRRPRGHRPARTADRRAARTAAAASWHRRRRHIRTG
jgi:hypothetical protein